MISNFLILIFLGNVVLSTCDIQMGPDPWDYVSDTNFVKNDENIPPDLKLSHQLSKRTQANHIGSSEWFYRRILAIVLKGGHIKKNEDGTVDVALQMKYTSEKWRILEEYIKSNIPLSDDMLRRSMGYVEESIYRPTITQKIVMAWGEYIQFYLVEYKTPITWSTSVLAGIIAVFWLWKHISHKHIIILAILALYLYEVLISYKEAEKEELEKFVAAVNLCKWYFWTSECEVPPDPLIFLKYMNPLKIGIRMFTTLLSEPMITISETIRIIIHRATDGLWFPFDKIMYGFMFLSFYALIILLLIMIIFNYILNIPFSLNFLGILSIGLKQRNRSAPNIIQETAQAPSAKIDNRDRISGENLTKFLDVYTRALSTVHSAQTAITERCLPSARQKLSITSGSTLKKSASTGRLPNYSDIEKHEQHYTESHLKHSNGSGDRTYLTTT